MRKLARRPSIRAGAIAACLALTATACGGSGGESTANEPTSDVSEDSAAPSGGAGLPQLVGATVAGGQLDTNALAGQDVVVWFWAPW